MQGVHATRKSSNVAALRYREAIVAAMGQVFSCAIVIGCMLSVVGLPTLERQLAQQRAARELERELEDVRQELIRERIAADAERRRIQETISRIDLIERSIGTKQEQLAAERRAREAAEVATQEVQQVREKLEKATTVLGWLVARGPTGPSAPR